jgi:hypothetical protein
VVGSKDSVAGVGDVVVDGAEGAVVETEAGPSRQRKPKPERRREHTRRVGEGGRRRGA